MLKTYIITCFGDLFTAQIYKIYKLRIRLRIRRVPRRKVCSLTITSYVLGNTFYRNGLLIFSKVTGKRCISKNGVTKDKHQYRCKRSEFKAWKLISPDI